MLTLTIGVACDSTATPDGREQNLLSTRQTVVPDEEFTEENSEEGAFVIDMGGGPRSMPLPPIRRYWGVEQSTKPTRPETQDGKQERTPTQIASDVAEAAPPNEEMSVTLELAEVPFDWSPIKGLTDIDARAAIVEQRITQLRPNQAALIAWLSNVGAKEINPNWLTNSVQTVLRAKDVAKAIAHPDVVKASRSVTIASEAEWTGRQAKDAVRITNLYNAGITGSVGGPGGGTSNPVVIGIVESSGLTNVPHVSHDGFDDLVGINRFLSVKDCENSSCPNIVPSPNAYTHATLVSWVAGGSIEAGQDAAFPGTNTADQRARSGLLKGAYLRFYSAATTDGLYRSLARATFDGVNVINMSWGNTLECDRSVDYSGINAALAAIADLGVVMVKSAGNSGDGTTCRLSWPAQRTEVITVGNVDSSDDTIGYNSLPIRPSSSRGGVQVRTYSNNYIGYLAGVDLVAPGVYRQYFAPPNSSYSASATSGTSFATAAVTAMMGGLRSAFHSLGWSTANTRAMMVNGLLMGDGWNLTVNPSTAGLHPRTGAGRAKLHWPSGSDLTGPWAWGWRAVHLYPGNSVTWPVGSGGILPGTVTLWKWAVLWTASDLGAVPDVDLYVEDNCGGGNPTQIIVSDVGYDVRARFRLTQAHLMARCLRMRATAYSVPPGGVTIYSADYYHSGPTAVH